jgi:hypothetical protein
MEPPPQPMFEAPDIDKILSQHDPARLHPLANLDKQTLDYIILEDEQIKSQGALPSRGWTDDLCYGTGTTYLTGPLPPPTRGVPAFAVWFWKGRLTSSVGNRWYVGGN